MKKGHEKKNKETHEKENHGLDTFDTIVIIRIIVIAIIMTNITLIGIYVISNEWWGILIKIILALLAISMLINYFRDSYWKGIGPGIFLNMIWFSGIWFFSGHWAFWIFWVLYLITTGTMISMLRKD